MTGDSLENLLVSRAPTSARDFLLKRLSCCKGSGNLNFGESILSGESLESAFVSEAWDFLKGGLPCCISFSLPVGERSVFGDSLESSSISKESSFFHGLTEKLFCSRGELTFLVGEERDVGESSLK